MSRTPHQKAFDLAKLKLMMKPNVVFYTTILFSLKHVWLEDDHPLWGGNRPTAATDGIHLFNNPGFFMSLDLEEQIFLIMHEIGHVAYDHFNRIGDKRCPDIWNEAGDYIINGGLVKSGFKMLKIGLLDRKTFDSMDTEGAYDHLAKNRNSGKPGLPMPGGGSGLAKDIKYPKPGSKAAKDLKRHVEDILVRAAIQSKASNDAPGTIPGDIEIMIEEILNPKLPWEIILQNHMSSYAKEDYSMQRPNRRFMPEFYLPTTFSEAICNLVVAPDISGSTVHNDQFNYFIREIQSIKETCKPEKITLIPWDTKLKKIQEITDDTNIMKDVKFHGGGGTQIEPLIAWLIKHKPEVAIIFSDGEFHLPTQQPKCDVIWVIHNDENWTAPYGRIIHYTMKD
jgi:predicted metal-dependent peptidase